MGKSRIEAFTDGVLAIAITLLALQLRVDVRSSASLLQQLRGEKVVFVIYAVSFFLVGIIWVNHHLLFSLVTRIDRKVLFYNLFFLMWVALLPFATIALASGLQHSSSVGDSYAGVAVYGIVMEGVAAGFAVLLWHFYRAKLINRTLSPRELKSVMLRFTGGVVVVPVITAIGLVSPVLMLVLWVALILFYVFGPAYSDIKAEEA